MVSYRRYKEFMLFGISRRKNGLRNFFLPLLFSFVNLLCILKTLFWLCRKLLISSVCFHFSCARSVIFKLCCFLLVALPFARHRGKKSASFYYILFFPNLSPFTFVQRLSHPFHAIFSQNLLEMNFKRVFSIFFS